ncbi:hypothetical protein [Crossiella sp. NPDC003009]
MGDNEEKEEEHEHGSVELSRRARIVTGSAAILSGSTGAVAVFLTSNQAGTAVLLALCALFSLMTLAGRLPSRLKFGDNEFTIPLIKAVENRIAEASPEEAKELVSAVTSSLSGSASSQSNVERTLLGAVVEQSFKAAVLKDGRFEIKGLTRSSKYDMELVGPKRVAVKIVITPAHYGDISRRIRDLRRVAAEDGYDACIFMSNYELSPKSLAVANAFSSESGKPAMHYLFLELNEPFQDHMIEMLRNV